MVFKELYRRYGSIYNQNIYYSADATWECDFIVFIEGKVHLPIQVCWSMEDIQTRDRELKGLIKACQYCGVNEGWIITADEDEEMDLDGVHVIVRAAWKWMISE